MTMNVNEMTGSPKQKKWANNLRYQWVSHFVMEREEQVAETLASITDSRFWIDNREENTDFFRKAGSGSLTAASL